MYLHAGYSMRASQASGACGWVQHSQTPKHNDPKEVIMSISNSTEKTTPVDAAEAEVVGRLCQLDVICDRLGQAHATLDLLHTMAADPDRQQEMLEGLCEGTLNYAIHSAMLRIEEALEAAKGVSHG
jgi:hypothetical protein